MGSTHKYLGYDTSVLKKVAQTDMDRRRSGGPFRCVVRCSCSGRVTRGLQERPHLAACGLQHNVKQCKDKLKALNKKYKEVINRHRQSGAGVELDEEVTQRDFWFFLQIHHVLGGRVVANPPHLLEISSKYQSTDIGKVEQAWSRTKK